MNIGEKIKNLRVSNNLSQQQTADFLGLTRGCYAHYEQGLREPSLETLKLICKFFNVSADYLLGLKDC